MATKKFDPALLQQDLSFDTDELDAFVAERDQSLALGRLLSRRMAVSDQIVDAHRELMRLTASGQGGGVEAEKLHSLIQTLQEKQVALNAEVEAELQRQQDTGTDQAIQQTGRGLVKIRHPNRDFFIADLFGYALKDDIRSMEAPIFSLSTKPDLSIWKWQSENGKHYVEVVPSVLGRATQHDKDVLIYVISQITEGQNRGREDTKNQLIRFTVHDFLVTTNRQTGGESYKRLHEALRRLQGTSIYTNIPTGGELIKEQFGIIDRWKIVEKSKTDERMIAVEVKLSDWLYNAIQAFEVLTIHPDYFRLRSPLARRVYEIARKYCGRQTDIVRNLTVLQQLAGSKSTLKEFRRAIRAIQADDSLPEYRISLGAGDKVTFYPKDAKRLVKGLAARMPPAAETWKK